MKKKDEMWQEKLRKRSKAKQIKFSFCRVYFFFCQFSCKSFFPLLLSAQSCCKCLCSFFDSIPCCAHHIDVKKPEPKQIYYIIEYSVSIYTWTKTIYRTHSAQQSKPNQHRTHDTQPFSLLNVYLSNIVQLCCVSNMRVRERIYKMI